MTKHRLLTVGAVRWSCAVRDNRLKRWVGVLGVATALACAHPRRPPRTAANVLRGDIEQEYYVPIHPNRQVNSTFLNASVGIQLLPPRWPVRFDVLGGVTVTGASGNIVQSDGNGADVQLETGVVGAGPILLARFEPLHLDRFAISADALGGVVFYSARFPPGGDVYNFTWRLGGSMALRVTRLLWLSAGIRWMHVSNGQGLGPWNPSYEGVGGSLEAVFQY